MKNLRAFHKAIQWLIVASAVLLWTEVFFKGWQNITFQRSFSAATALLFLFALQSFLKWKISEAQQQKENGLFSEWLLRDLDNLKDELGWDGNARLDVAMQKLMLELKSTGGKVL